MLDSLFRNKPGPIVLLIRSLGIIRVNIITRVTRNLPSFPKFPIISLRIRWFSSFAGAHVSPCMRSKTLKWTKDQSKIRRNSLPHRISSFEGGRELLLTELSLAAYLLTLLLAISKHSSISRTTEYCYLCIVHTHTHTHIYFIVYWNNNDSYDDYYRVSYTSVHLKKKKKKKKDFAFSIIHFHWFYINKINAGRVFT